MAVSLYDISIGSYLQVVDACRNVLKKGAGSGLDLTEVVDARLRPDMFPFRFQVVSVWHHSLGAIKGIEAGVFSPPPALGELDYRALQGLLDEAADGLRQYPRADIEALEGRPVKFKMGDFEIPFSAEDFILTFSLPNLYFHATTAYDILRMLGAPLGKLDFLGQMRVRT